MANRLLITGANGFVGAHLVRRMRRLPFEEVKCLSRRPHDETETEQDGAPCRWVTGDIRDPSSTCALLEDVDTVVHLAALTGKQRSKDHFSVNADGTRVLVESCRRAGVRHFLHVSTIAVTYPGITHYPYAQSKLEAEQIVRNSRLHHTIIRPTIVVGAQCPSWQAFRTLAAGPVILGFGDGTTHVQPIHVDDLVTCILTILHRDEFDGATFEIGGAARTTMNQFLSGINRLYHERQPIIVRIPLWPTMPCLVAAETVFGGMLPLTVGQLSPFRYDSTANHELAYPGLECAIDSIADMLDHIAEEERHGVPYARTLDRECRVFTSHLIDREPDEYILARYRDAHEKVHELRLARPSMFDRALIAIASRSSFLARFVDVYTRVFAPHAMVRKKWILLLSLLEVSASTHALFDAPQKKRSVPVALALLAAGVRFSLFLCLSSLAFAPLHAACVGGASIRRRID